MILGTQLGGKPALLETVMPTATGFGLPDDPLVLPSLPVTMLRQDFDKRPEQTMVKQDAVVD